MLIGFLFAMLSVLVLGEARVEAQDKPRSGGELIYLVPSEPPVVRRTRRGDIRRRASPGAAL